MRSTQYEEVAGRCRRERTSLTALPGNKSQRKSWTGYAAGWWLWCARGNRSVGQTQRRNRDRWTGCRLRSVALADVTEFRKQLLLPRTLHRHNMDGTMGNVRIACR